MHKSFFLLATAMVTATPAQAADWQLQAAETRIGMFVGARLRMPFSGDIRSAPRASFSVAPTRLLGSNDGSRKIQFGEGLALSLTPAEKGAITIGGVPAKTALGLKTRGAVDSRHKQGISTGGKVAIGAAVVAAAIVGIALYTDKVDDSSD